MIVLAAGTAGAQPQRYVGDATPSDSWGSIGTHAFAVTFLTRSTFGSFGSLRLSGFGGVTDAGRALGPVRGEVEVGTGQAGVGLPGAPATLVGTFAPAAPPNIWPHPALDAVWTTMLVAPPSHEWGYFVPSSIVVRGFRSDGTLAFEEALAIQHLPEPTTVVLTAGGLLVLAGIARQRRS